MTGRLVFGREDLLRCRFAISPLWETFAAVHILFEPHRHGFHLPWVRAARLPAEVDLATLRLLLPRPGYVPDFLTPPPEGPLTRIEEELDRLRATSVPQVGAELRRCLLDRRRGLPPAVTGPLLVDPGTTRDALADLFEHCWHHLVRPHWPRLRALLDADIARQARLLAEGGLVRLLRELHPAVRWDDGGLRVDAPAQGSRDLEGSGLVLMPSAFVWPDVIAMMDPPWQPTLIYPARGIGDLWSPPAGRPPRALSRLLGRTRARLLCALAEPGTTTSLAAAYRQSPASVSGHLTALRDAGLLESWRVGRRVFYARTPLGEALVGDGAPEEAREGR